MRRRYQATIRFEIEDDGSWDGSIRLEEIDTAAVLIKWDQATYGSGRDGSVGTLIVRLANAGVASWRASGTRAEPTETEIEEHNRIHPIECDLDEDCSCEGERNADDDAM